MTPNRFKDTLRIGVTGGIGSGKSLVMDILEKEYGAYIILSDLVAHELMEPGARSYQDILENFGNDILDRDGRIDRLKLSAIVFADPEKLARLNGITHPNVIQEIRDRMAGYARRNEEEPGGKQNLKLPAIIVVESALLLEAGMEEEFDSLWYIFADRDVRLKRLMEGRDYTKDRAEGVMARQKNEEYYRERCQVIIDNSGSPDQTAGQVRRAMEGLLAE